MPGDRSGQVEPHAKKTEPGEELDEERLVESVVGLEGCPLIWCERGRFGAEASGDLVTGDGPQHDEDDYRDTEHYGLTRTFLNDTERMLDILLDRKPGA